ncbi:leucine-rich repeat-containing protein 63 [Trichosurus vulpecula]|uniref:leucine-rich repeat-containing protein 63 n=1 Tax=Trichosurus vulpecula TaxID=9337 RepID=UPI00186B2D3F|nr:leucine-rich repeat-containing protein 63 [Trichosurus vulpecula]
MLTLPKLLRRPLPPKTHNKPLHLKKGKIESAITSEVSKQQDFFKPYPRKLIPTEIEKNIIPGKFPKRRRQSRVHIKNLLLKWHVKRYRDASSKMFLQKYPKFYVLFPKMKDNYASPFYLSAYNSIKEEIISGKSSLQCKLRNYFLDGALEKDSTTSSETSTPTSSQLGQSSSSIKPDLEHVTTPDSTYMPLICSSRSVDESQTVSKKVKTDWYDRLKITYDTMSKQNFSFDELSAALPRKPYRQCVLETSKTEEGKVVCKESSPTEKIIDFPDFSVEVTASEEELIVLGEGYCRDSLQSSDDPKINLARIAVLRCHQHGRNALSFKGFFIENCPNLSILTHQLVYLNLAFNSLTIFPPEVLVLVNLQVLIMRNNPIKEISSDIDALKSLTIFVISYNLLTSLPVGLFSLSKLESLDVSHNEITSIPNEIKNLSALNNLNLDGNELTSLPPGILKLSPDNFTVENNFLHPLFWKENSINDAQSLKDLALVCFSKNQLWKFYEVLPEEIKQQLVTSKLCDYCQGSLYGKGLHLIRPFDVFNTPLLPILFNVCSPRCFKYTKLDPNIMTRLTR